MAEIRKPFKVFDNKTNFLDYTSNVQLGDRVVGWKAQNQLFEKTVADPFAGGDYLYIISSSYNHILPQLAANKIVEAVEQKHLAPYWYNVIKNHKTEDQKIQQYVEEFNEIDLLVIDGVFSKTNINNIDKLRELIATYEGIPIIVLVSGGFGPEIFKEQVFCAFNKFLHFAESSRKKVKQL